MTSFPLGSAEVPEPDAGDAPEAVEAGVSPPQATRASSMLNTKHTLSNFFIRQGSSFFKLACA